MAITVDGRPGPAVGARRRPARWHGGRSAPSTGPGLRATLAVRGGIDVPALPRQPVHVHARAVRRPRGPARWPTATSCRRRRVVAEPAGRCRRAWRRASATTWEIGVLVGPHTAPEFLTPDGPPGAAAHHVGRRRQLGPHRRAPRRPEAPLGPGRRRRRRPPPLEHPRHRLRHRLGRPHRRHAGDPRARRAEPGRVRLPGGGGRARAVEARPAPAGRRRPAGAVVAGAGRGGRGPPAGVARPGHRPHRAAGPARLERRGSCAREQAGDRRHRPRRGRPTRRRPSPTARPATGSCSSSSAR